MFWATLYFAIFVMNVEFTHEAPPATGIASFRSATILNIQYVMWRVNAIFCTRV